MIYTFLNHDRQSPDSVKKYTFKTLTECYKKTKKKKIKIELPILKKIDKKNDEVVAFLNGNITNIYEERPMSDFYKTFLHSQQFYCECEKEKKKFHYISGYLQVDVNKYIATQSSIFPFFLIFFAIVFFLCFVFLFSRKDIKIEFGNWINVEKNENIVDLDNIPSDTDKIDITSDMAYISGQSLTIIKENYQNVYLVNDKRNDKYVLIYEVFVNNNDEYVYKSGTIPAGQAEPWNAYQCDQIKKGENDISYEVYVYDLEGNQVAQTSLTGLTIIKQ